jgi:hypothetical protein
MASSISICSNALLALGAHPINSFDEASEHARLCSNIYPTVLHFPALSGRAPAIASSLLAASTIAES